MALLSISPVSTTMSNRPLLFSSPNPNPILLQSSFLPLNPIPFSAATATTAAAVTKKKRSIPVSSSVNSPIKMVRCPGLDRRAAKHSRLRFVRKLRTLLLSKPRHFLPLRVLSRCRPYLSLPPSRSLLSMLLRYPTIFHLFHSPTATCSSSSSSSLCVGLTPAAASLAADESLLRSRIAVSLANKLQRLLMLSSHRRLLLSKLAHLAPDLGFSPDFRSRLCNSHPHIFRTVDTSFGRALELVHWDPALAVPHPPFLFDAGPESIKDRPIIDRPPKFKQLKLRRGLNLKRRHRDYLIQLQELPESSPYSLDEAAAGSSLEAMEKRACAVVREVLAMTLEKRTLVDHLTHFRKEFGLPNKLRAMLVRHPEVFYVSVRGQRNSVFLVETYDDKGKLMVEDEMLLMKQRLMKLVMEGKRMRRERRRDVSYVDESDEEEEDNDDIEEVIDDGFDDLFETGIGDDWEEFDADNAVDAEVELREQGDIEEFWIKKAIGERVGGTHGGMEAW